MGYAKRRFREDPTPMGERILAFMSANYVKDFEEFAEGLLAVPVNTLMAWIYDELDPETLPIRPMLLLADALGTNAEYLTCMSDDPRPGFELTYDESVLLQAFRDADLAGREVLMRAALEIAARNPAGHASGASPYPRAPRRPPPANEVS